MVTKNIAVAEIVIASRITLDLRILLVLAFEDMGLEGICSIYVLTSAFFLFFFGIFPCFYCCKSEICLIWNHVEEGNGKRGERTRGV